MNKVMAEIYETRTTQAADGRVIPLHSEIAPGESRFLYDRLMAAPQALKTLEVGCAYGLSSLAICEALKNRPGAHHAMIDPFQFSDWSGAGVSALQRAGLQNFTLIEQLSEIALPNLLLEHEGTFDFIFVDGWHTFDHTLLDCFYALRLLQPGGLLVVDDCDWPPIAKVIRYLAKYPNIRVVKKSTDYPKNPLLNGLSRLASLLPISNDMRHYLPGALQRLIRRPNMVCLQKIADDTRKGDWYRPF